jgi:release factor glutamine methyltransferase
VKYGGKCGCQGGAGLPLAAEGKEQSSVCPQCQAIARRRIAGEPLQYLLGEWEFYGYPFKVGEGVLIPRPETELLVDLAKEYCFDSDVLDLCAGTGCVGISLARERDVSIIAVEKSPEAIAYLKENVRLHDSDVQIIEADVLDFTHEEISEFARHKCAILINPPYLSESEMQNLQKEVTHEPEMALYGGGDGLDFYRAFFEKWADAIEQSPLFATEVGDGQAAAVSEMMRQIRLRPQIKKDYNGIERIVYHA